MTAAAGTPRTDPGRMMRAGDRLRATIARVTDWRKLIDDGGVLPDGPSRAALIAEVCEALRPVVRDEQALSLLADWIPGLDSAERHALGDAMTRRFEDSEIQARTYAA
jgi:hypothetical protein